jgi:bacteriorhodopsin
MNNIVIITTYISIILQFVTGILSLGGIMYKLPVPHKVLNDALNLELGVQIVEMIFYIILVMFFAVKDMATVRYFDWLITTPLMLFTTMLVYEYLVNVEYMKDNKEEDKPLTLTNFIEKYRKDIIYVVIANAMMLVFGFLGEIGVMNIYVSTILGFIAMGVSFYIIYDKFAINLKSNDKLLFYLLISFWSLYGIAFLFPTAPKNISYNFLDIIAKNFFGLYLYYKIVTVSKDLKNKDVSN